MATFFFGGGKPSPPQVKWSFPYNKICDLLNFHWIVNFVLFFQIWWNGDGYVRIRACKWGMKKTSTLLICQRCSPCLFFSSNFWWLNSYEMRSLSNDFQLTQTFKWNIAIDIRSVHMPISSWYVTRHWMIPYFQFKIYDCKIYRKMIFGIIFACNVELSNFLWHTCTDR